MPARNLLNAERLAKAYGHDLLLDGVSLGIAEGERIGVVGRNGDGKSTLLRILAGSVPPDAGRVTRSGRLRLGMLGQSDEVDDSLTVGEFVIANRDVHEWASDARQREVLTALLGGHNPALLERTLGPMSGGERRRAELARLLLEDLDLLFLDEPTNHLDVEAVAWLADHLRNRKSTAVVVVTHDRWFLDEVCERMWEVVDGGVAEYDGGYSAFVLAKAERVRQASTERQRRNNLIRKELAWLRRGPPARTSKPRFRVDAANALIADEPPARNDVELLAFAGARLGKLVLELHDVSLSFGSEPAEERTLLDRVVWNVGPGDRIGIIGVNGAGKTSLVKVLLGFEKPSSGRVVTGSTVKSAYLSQHLDELDPSWRVLEAVEDVAQSVELGGGRTLTATQLCERLGFGPDNQWTPIGDLSGGERRRLQLTRLLMSGPNVLVLDEPTNDFDVETLTALEDLLDSFAGSLLVISHDRYFLERVCGTFVGLLGDGRVRDLPRGVDEYLSLHRTVTTAQAQLKGPPTVVPSSSAADERAQRKTLARLDRQLKRVSTEVEAVHDQMSRHATDHERIAALHEQLRELETKQQELEEQWLEVAEAVHE